MSALTAAGSTARWRRIRAPVLERDSWRCRFVDPDRSWVLAPCTTTVIDAYGIEQYGQPPQICGRGATTVHHIRSRAHGGSDQMSNLVAACAPCNQRAGAGSRDTAAVGPLSPAQARLVGMLDQLQVAPEVGYRRAAETLALADVAPPRRGDLLAACRWRRARAQVRPW